MTHSIDHEASAVASRLTAKQYRTYYFTRHWGLFLYLPFSFIADKAADARLDGDSDVVKRLLQGV